MDTENVYLGRDNTINLILKADGSAVDLTAVTKISITFGTTVIESSNGVTDPILWVQTGYNTGEIRLKLGAQAIPAGTYQAALIVYEATYPNGIHWGTVRTVVES